MLLCSSISSNELCTVSFKIQSTKALGRRDIGVTICVVVDDRLIQVIKPDGGEVKLYDSKTITKMEPEESVLHVSFRASGKFTKKLWEFQSVADRESFTKLIRAMNSCGDEARAIFRQLDRRHCGELSAADLATVAQEHGVDAAGAAAMMKLADTRGTGLLDFRDFLLVFNGTRAPDLPSFLKFWEARATSGVGAGGAGDAGDASRHAALMQALPTLVNEGAMMAQEQVHPRWHTYSPLQPTTCFSSHFTVPVFIFQ